MKRGQKEKTTLDGSIRTEFNQANFSHGSHQSSSTAHFFSTTTAASATGRWTPNTDIYATETGLVIKAELAGMKSDSLEITVEGQRLRINGVRPDCCRAPNCSFLVMEISYGPFETCWICRRATIWARRRRFM